MVSIRGVLRRQKHSQGVGSRRVVIASPRHILAAWNGTIDPAPALLNHSCASDQLPKQPFSALFSARFTLDIAYFSSDICQLPHKVPTKNYDF